MAEILLSPLFLPEESSKEMFFWKLSYFKCTNKKKVNDVCFNSRKVTFSTAEITFVLY